MSQHHADVGRNQLQPRSLELTTPPPALDDLSVFQVPSQVVDATQALNRSAGVANSRVLRGRSLSCRAAAEAIATELASVPNLTVEIVEAILAELRASGDFDRIVADAKASMATN